MYIHRMRAQIVKHMKVQNTSYAYENVPPPLPRNEKNLPINMLESLQQTVKVVKCV